MTTVIDVEDKAPYVEVVSRQDEARAFLIELAELYERQAKDLRNAKRYKSANLDTLISITLRAAVRDNDPEAGIHTELQGVAYVLTEIREAKKMLEEEMKGREQTGV